MRPSSFFGASPWQLMRRMQEDVDHLLSEFVSAGGGAARLPATEGAWAPTLDISQTEREFIVEADLPGARQEDIEVEVRDRNLVIRAEMRQAEEERPERGGRRYYRRERRYGFFERVLPLPENVDEENIRCTFRNGVLTVQAPLMAPVRPQGRKIPVSAAAEEPALAGAKGGEAGPAASQGAPQPEGGQAAQGQPGQQPGKQPEKK